VRIVKEVGVYFTISYRQSFGKTDKVHEESQSISQNSR